MSPEKEVLSLTPNLDQFLLYNLILWLKWCGCLTTFTLVTYGNCKH